MPGLPVAHRRRTAPPPPEASSSNLLDHVEWDPGSEVTRTVTNTAGAPFDPALEVSFPNPASRTVYAVLSGYAASGGASADQRGGFWTLWDSADTAVFEPVRMHNGPQARGGTLFQYIDLSGYSVGQQITLRWVGVPEHADGQSLFAGGAHGRPSMQIWLVDTDDPDALHLLGRTSYDPDPFATATSPSTSLLDIDATNGVLTFTSTGAGEVFLCGYGFGGCSTFNSVGAAFGWREATTQVAGEALGPLQASGPGGNHWLRFAYRKLITGLTPNTQYTWKAAIRGAGSTTAEVRYGTGYGPLVLEAWDPAFLLDHVYHVHDPAEDIRNAAANTMEEIAGLSAGHVAGDMRPTFTPPSSKVGVVISSGIFVPSASDLGWIGLLDDPAGTPTLVAGSRAKMVSTTDKRLKTYSRIIEGLTPDVAETWAAAFESNTGPGAPSPPAGVAIPTTINAGDNAFPQQIEIWKVT